MGLDPEALGRPPSAWRRPRLHLETVVAPPLEASRAEVEQLRQHDRQEMEAQIEHLARRLQ